MAAKISLQKLRKTIDAVAAMKGQGGAFGNSTSGGVQPRVQPIEQWWIGIIMSAGPASEADWSDARYWVKTAAITNAAGTNPIAAALPTFESPLPTFLELDPGGVPVANGGTNPAIQWLTATNLDEIVAGTHNLSAGSIVNVGIIQGADAAPYYVFSGGT